jgi:hypothetical protein
MRVRDKAILDAWFAVRQEAFINNIESVPAIEALIKNEIKDIQNSSDIANSQSDVLKLSSVLNHYREICYFSEEHNVDLQLLDGARNALALVVNNENVSDALKIIALYAIGMSFVPFIRGAAPISILF